MTTNSRRAIPTQQEFYKTKAGTKTYVALLLNSTLNMDTKVRTFDASTINLGNFATQTIVLQDLGMVNNGKNQNVIKDVLNSLINEGLIKYVNHKTPKGNIIKQLTELNKSVKQNDIPTFNIDEEVEVLKASDFKGSDF